MHAHASWGLAPRTFNCRSVVRMSVHERNTQFQMELKLAVQIVFLIVCALDPWLPLLNLRRLLLLQEHRELAVPRSTYAALNYRCLMPLSLASFGNRGHHRWWMLVLSYSMSTVKVRQKTVYA